jgi:hypothetical protein
MNTKLAILLKDFGFKVEVTTIIELGVNGFTRDRIFGRCRDLFDAAEQLRPIIRDDEYTRRHMAICPN